MASYQLTLSGAFNDLYTYPWSSTTTIADAYEPIKRVRTLESGTVDELFDREDILGCSAVIKNLDDTNNIRVIVQETSGDTMFFSLPPGRILVVPDINFQTNRDGSAFSAYTEWDTISAEAESGTPQVELLVIGSDTTAS